MTASAQFKMYLDILYRRKWWIVVPLVVSAVASFFVIRQLPKMYRSSTTILVMPQRIPDEIARTTVTAKVEDRMSSMKVQILSRSFLETVAREFDFVSPSAEEPELERACGRLRSRIELTPGQNLSYFEIAVEDEDAKRSADVANRLAALFIEQNSQMRSEQAEGTRTTVEGWLAEKKADLDAMEVRIADYKRSHLWELGEQLNANLQLLNAAQQRATNLSKDIENREGRIADLRTQLRNDALLDSTSVSAEPDPNVRKLAQLESELAQLKVTYTDENPAVRRKEYEISEFKNQHPQLGQPVGTPERPRPTSPRQAEIDRLQKEIANLERDRDATQAQISGLGGRINNTPLREQELTALTRGYGSLKAEYEDLMKKREIAGRAEELEESRKSEQFRVQDPARTPSIPFRPQPLQVLLICLMGGLGLGAAAVVLLEFLDQSFRNEDDFRRAFPEMALLSSLPHLDVKTNVAGPRKAATVATGTGR